jgi:chromosome partitioning protein
MIIVIANQKGGVGKTTTAVTMATGMASMGYATVLVDADSQGNAAQFLGLEPRPDLYRLMIQERPPAEVIQRVEAYPLLGVVAGNADTIEIEDALSRGRRLQTASALRLALSRFGSKTAIIVDTAPSLSNIQVSALNAADWLIIPAIPEYAAETGVAALAQTVAALQEAGGKINLLGVLPTMVDSRSREHAETIARWAVRFPGLVLPMVRRLIAFGKARGGGGTDLGLRAQRGGGLRRDDGGHFAAPDPAVGAAGGERVNYPPKSGGLVKALVDQPEP